MDYTRDEVLSVDLSDFAVKDTWDPYYGAIPHTTITDTGTYDNSVWTVGTSGTGGPSWQTITPVQPSAKIDLYGEDADIRINGQSLCDTIRGIQDRLNILCPDPEMEQEWDELRALREAYDAKLQECREKSRAWKALKQQG